MLPLVAPGRVSGTHVTGTIGGDAVRAAARAGRPRAAPTASGPSASTATATDGLGYLHMQSTRPQTLAYALNDSPVGQLAWIVEKFQEWTDPAAELPEDAVDRDQLLTNVSVYWFTGAGASSAHATYEGMQAWRQMAAQGRRVRPGPAGAAAPGRGGVRGGHRHPQPDGPRGGDRALDRVRPRRATSRRWRSRRSSPRTCARSSASGASAAMPRAARRAPPAAPRPRAASAAAARR